MYSIMGPNIAIVAVVILSIVILLERSLSGHSRTGTAHVYLHKYKS